MEIAMPPTIAEEKESFKLFLDKEMVPNISKWYHDGAVPRSFYSAMGKADWFGYELKDGRLAMRSAFRISMILEAVAKISPGVGVTVLVQDDLGLMGLYLFGSKHLQNLYAEPALKGDLLVCVGNTERHAGSDVANIATQAIKVDGGWLLNGTKAYVTNGLIADLGVITAVTHPEAERNKRISMFMVDLNAKGVSRKKLNKQVWIPSDLTRIQLKDVFVPDDHFMGEPGQGLQQVLDIFTHSRVPISAMTLGTAAGAFELAIDHARKRVIFGQRLIDLQAKSFEIAEFYAQMEAARLVLYKACATVDKGLDFRLEASMAKYLSVKIAREVTTWAADLFGAASVMFEHPIHKFPLDTWGSALGEGTQDVQKLVIFREIMKKYES